MIRRRTPLRRSSNPIPRRVRPHPVRQTPRAALARECAVIWARAVRAKLDGRCWVGATFFGQGFCSGRIEAAHCFSKGACPAARYDLDLGYPLCAWHHRMLGNGDAWRNLLWDVWGAEEYAARYRRAHDATRRLDYADVRMELLSGGTG